MSFNLFKAALPATGRFFSTGAVSQAVQNVTIVGGGLMGSGIAQVAAQAGNNVKLVDVGDEVLKRTKAAMEKNVPKIAARQFKNDPGKVEEFSRNTLARIEYTTDLRGAVADADLVVEAIVENLEPKQKLFAEIDKAAPEKTIFASNTSSIPINEIAEKTSRKDRFGGLHFFSPVPLMRLLEVIRISETSDATFQAMDAWGKAIGKVTVSCKDTPGFIVNRLLIPYTREAVLMVERGDATPQDIDTAMKLGAGYPMGPFELSDMVGVDVGYFISVGWEKRFPDNPNFKVPEILKKMIKEGKLGRKTGEGWYKYDKK